MTRLVKFIRSIDSRGKPLDCMTSSLIEEYKRDGCDVRIEYAGEYAGIDLSVVRPDIVICDDVISD